MSNVPMTKLGVERLREELNRLISVDRREVVDAIAAARAHGDLKENAEYHAAKEKQGFIEGRIAQIESRLSHAQVIDISKIENMGKVIFGATVTLLNISTDKEVVYQIVGDDESDLKEGKISVNSPIARAMIGKSVGAVIEVRAPGGETEYEISKVDYI